MNSTNHEAPQQAPESPAISAVVLTQGGRPDELAAAVASVRGQVGVATEVVVVWNGVSVPADADPTCRHVTLPANVGIPEGRNVGAAEASAPLLLFLDDDAALGDTAGLGSVARLFDEDRALAVVSPRIVDEVGASAQRHVPRIGRRSAMRSGPVTTFLGGVAVIRRDAFDDVGGYEGALFYSMEETDLAWRLVDRRWGIWYAADVVVRHPRTDPSRHADSVRRTARNRMWIAHRQLPAVLALGYLSIWLAIAVVRTPRQLGTVLAGYRTGWRTPHRAPAPDLLADRGPTHPTRPSPDRVTRRARLPASSTSAPTTPWPATSFVRLLRPDGVGLTAPTTSRRKVCCAKRRVVVH